MKTRMVLTQASPPQTKARMTHIEAATGIWAQRAKARPKVGAPAPPQRTRTRTHTHTHPATLTVRGSEILTTKKKQAAAKCRTAYDTDTTTHNFTFPALHALRHLSAAHYALKLHPLFGGPASFGA